MIKPVLRPGYVHMLRNHSVQTTSYIIQRGAYENRQLLAEGRQVVCALLLLRRLPAYISVEEDILSITKMTMSDWILAIITIIGILYWLGTRRFDYFAKICVPYVRPVPFFGNMAPVVFRQASFPDLIVELYEKLKGYRYGGMFQFGQPMFFLRDPELIKMVTVKDFDHFVNHRQFTSEDVDPLMGKVLFNLRGQRWRDMRATLSPAFTSSKMKTMFPLMMDCGDQMAKYLEMCIKDENKLSPDSYKVEKDNGMLIIEMKDFYTRYTNDVIATAAFGISVDSLENPKNEFYQMGKTITNFSGIQALKFFIMMMSPEITKIFNVKFFSERMSKMLRYLVQDTMATREEKGIVRPDMIHLLMQAKKGTLSDGTTTDTKKPKQDWSDDDLTAQAVLFFLAGFDTASTLLCFMSHLLAMHPEVQTKLQNEIDEVLRENDGKISYEALHKMKYLDMVVSESLRMYPPGVLMDRMCTKPYTLSTEPPVHLQPGDQICIPAYALHRDPEYFPDPEKFDPERFSDENKHNINPFVYLPFGSGPRNCIGNRFALMESKLAVVHILSHFNLKVVPKTPIPIRITRKGLNMTIDGGFWLGLQLRNSTAQSN